MSEQVIITAHTGAPLKLALEAAIQNEMKLLAHGLERTHERLTALEHQYEMSSTEFERRFLARELGESLDFIEWLGEIKTLRLLEAQHHALQSAQIN